MEDEPEVVLEPDRNPLADTLEGDHATVVGVLEAGFHGTQQKRVIEPALEELVPHDPGLQGLQIQRDVGQLRHERRPIQPADARALP